MLNEVPVGRKRVKRKTFKRTLLVMLGLIVLIVGMFAFMLFGPSVPIVVSTKTTYLTEPLDKYGRVDYFEAVRREQKKGITVDNNAAVLLWQAWGWMDLEPKYIGPHFDELGIPIPPEDGDYLISIADNEFVAKGVAWLQSIRDATSDVEAGDTSEENPSPSLGVEWESADLRLLFDELTGRAMGHPWRSEDIPPLAEWLKQNKTPIELIFESTKRPRLYAPMVRSAPGKQFGETLLDLRLPTAQNSRAAARALAVRSMWHLGEGRVDAAWEDAMACHRLARLVGQGPTLVGQLVALAIDSIAQQLDLAILQQRLMPTQIERIGRDLAGLQPCCDMARTMNGSERFFFLDAVMALARGANLGEFAGEGLGGIATRISIDWNVPLQMGNEYYNEIVTAASIPRFVDRQAALEKTEARIKQLVDNDSMPQRFAISVVSRRARSDLMGSALAALFLPAVTAATAAEDRSNTHFALTQVAVKLAAYRAEHGAYAAKLEDLNEDVFAKLPLDLFSEKPFLYQRRGEGYLLSSVGPNQQDDGGSNSRMDLLEGAEVNEEEDLAKQAQIDPNADDFAIRLPRPQFSWSERIAEVVRSDDDGEGAPLEPPAE